MNCCTRVSFLVFKLGIQIYDWMFRKKYIPIPKHRISASKLPWLFVGIELTDGNVLDKTAHVQDLMDSGVQLTVTNICMFVEPRTIKRCFYLDEKTLKEEEIPTEGITINDP